MTVEKAYEVVIEYWMQFGLGVLSGYLVFKVRKMADDARKERCRREALELGMQALLRNAIISSYNKNKERGYMPIHERDNIIMLHKQYKVLEGNGVVDHLIEDVMELPPNPPVITTR